MGEMERDAIVAHGASYLISQRFASDSNNVKNKLSSSAIVEPGLLDRKAMT